MPEPQPGLSLEQTQRRTRRDIVLDGLCSRLMDVLTGGVFLAGLGLMLGADNFLIGVLASLPFLAQLAQFPAVKLLMRVPDRKVIVILASATARSVLLLMAALLWFGRLDLTWLVALVSLMALFTVVSTAAWNWWMRDILPRGSLGRFFGFRLQFTTLVAAGGLLAGGLLLDHFVAQGRAPQGYAWLFLVGAAAGALSLVFLARTPHVPALRVPGNSPFRAMLDSFRSHANRRLVLAITLVSATLTIALPFVAVFLIRSLELSFMTITVMALVSQVGYAGSLRGWGYLSDHFGNRPILLISMGLLVASLAGWLVVNPSPGFIVLGLVGVLHFLTGFAIGGVELTNHNILLKTAPDQGAPAYLAAMNFVKASIAGLATIGAGAAWQGLGVGDVVNLEALVGTPWPVRGFHVLVLASVVCGLLAILALRRIDEEGGAPVVEVARAMRREVRQLSSIAGIRAFVHVVSYVVEFVAAPRESSDVSTKKEAEASPRDRL